MIEEKMVILREDDDNDYRSVLKIERGAGCAFIVRLEDQELFHGRWRSQHYTDGDHFLLDPKEARKVYDALHEIFTAPVSVNVTGEPMKVKGRSLVEVFKGAAIQDQAEQLSSDPLENPPPDSPGHRGEPNRDLLEGADCDCCFCAAVRQTERALPPGALYTLMNMAGQDFATLHRRLEARVRELESGDKRTK